MRKKIVLIESDEVLKKYLYEKFISLNLDVVACKDGFEGIIKIKNENPDLIIASSALDRMDIFEVLKEKFEYKATQSIPFIILLPENDEELNQKFSSFHVTKVLAKPLKVDLLYSYISDILKIKIDFDKAPSVIDAHINSDILFIEIADGLNKEKIEILKYKIISLMEGYQKNLTKVLIIFSNIEETTELAQKLTLLLDIILDETAAITSSIKILTSAVSPIISTIQGTEYRDIAICEDFTEAINSFGKIDIFAYGDEIDEIKSEILLPVENILRNNLPMDLTFSSERNPKKNNYSIAIIDDDLSILEFISTVFEAEGWTTYTYENPIVFLKDLNNNRPDLLFLDLMMPEMNGFQLLQYFKSKNVFIPTVIITALSQKEFVVKAGRYGVSHFLTKPLKSEILVNKVKELLNISF